MTEAPSGTVTLLFTDVEGSTKLLQRAGDSYADLLAAHREVLRSAFAAHGGFEVDADGDAFFVVFSSAGEAVAAAAEGQRALDAHAWPDGFEVRVRMGIHTGEPRLIDGKYVGLDVHRAARVMAAGHGGQVLLSQSTRDLLEDRFATRDLGEHRLKDFDEPIPIFQLGFAGFPPLKTISNTNLPRPVSDFVGRARELEEIVELLGSRARLVTLTGPGGAGKTRLAIEAAGEVVGHYPAGVFWVGLAPLRDPTLVVETIAQTLGAKESLASFIGERRMLLLLDNLEQVIEAAPDLAELLEACPKLQLLCTSRESLRLSGEREYAVLPLAEDEALELFTARAQVEADAAATEICRRLDYLPLAIELAAARVKLLPPERLLERLVHRLPLLAGGARDAPDRQQTLRATIDWSRDLLTVAEKRLFRRLSVFAGCDLETAEAVAEADLDVLQSLVDKSLVRQTESRFWMLETIREYALERLQQSDDRERLPQRHAEHYLAVAERAAASDRQEVAPRRFQTLGEEHNNLRAARAWFHETRQSDAELRLVCALADFWDVRGHLREAYASFVAALEGSAPQSPALRARTLAVASDFARITGAVDDAKHFSQESLDLFRQLGDDAGIARALHELGESALEEEDYEGAIDLFNQAIAAGRAAGMNAAGSIANLGWAALLQGDYARAAALSERALALFRERGHASGELVALGNLAEAELGLGQREKASLHLTECLERAREAQFVEVIASCLDTTAALLLETGDAKAAARLTGAGDALLESIEFSLQSAERRRRERLRIDLGALLPTAAEELRSEGRHLTAEDASALALQALAVPVGTA